MGQAGQARVAKCSLEGVLAGMMAEGSRGRTRERPSACCAWRDGDFQPPLSVGMCSAGRVSLSGASPSPSAPYAGRRSRCVRSCESTITRQADEAPDYLASIYILFIGIKYAGEYLGASSFAWRVFGCLIIYLASIWVPHHLLGE